MTTPSPDVTAREAVERLARILRYGEDERQDRIEGGMMLVALLDRAEKAEAERDAAFAARHAASFVRGQRLARRGAYQACADPLGDAFGQEGEAAQALLLERIRALPITPEPSDEVG